MESEFYDLAHWSRLADQSELQLSKSKALLRAIERHRDFVLLELISLTHPNSNFWEGFIVEVEVDAVPPRNPNGILYRERLAIAISSDDKELVEVLALRKNFKVVVHANQSAPDTPLNLCLYFEAPAAVYRTWTPQNFLRRIQWWLEKTSRDELHPADQPLEHLFFASKYELIVPPDLEELKDSDKPLVISRSDARSDGGFTCFLDIKQDQQVQKLVSHIELTTQPVVNGSVERDPNTLGQLAELLLKRGCDLITLLKEKLRTYLTSEGVHVRADGNSCIVLLNVPVTRGEGLPPEKVSRRAFIILEGQLKLGELLGVSFVHEEKYFDAAGLLNKKESSEWKDLPLLAMDVRKRNTKADFRFQSGIDDEGPVGVLVGVGSLGSALLNLWGRSGWGEWSVIDRDHIKPHNLTRHTAFDCHVGQMKVTAVSDLHSAAIGGASSVNTIVEDACSASSDVMNALKNASLVVDASTTLEYPRLVSTLNEIGRHASVFITPDGQSAALLIEDLSRHIRLRTLEAQYYRGLIRNDWGERHLGKEHSTFWSGASCRDISFVMPYSAILGHASTLAEQIILAVTRSEALIRIWERDSKTGAVNVHDIVPCAEIQYDLQDFTLYMDLDTKAHLHAMREEHLPNETGGILVGYYDLTLKTVVIVDALPAPTDSKSSTHSFERGVNDVAESLAGISKRTAGIVSYVGEWHSHPKGVAAVPSGDDLFQLAYLSVGMADDGLPAIQIIVGDVDMSILQGHCR